MKITFQLVFILFLFCLSTAYSQQTEQLAVETTLTYAEFHGTVNPIENQNIGPDADKRKLSRRDHKINRNFEGRFPHKIVRPELEHLGPDKLRQTEVPVSKRPPLELSLNIEGLDNGNSPQDPSGDAGLLYYVQGVNATTIGCLLYTSPSPRDATLSRMPSSA